MNSYKFNINELAILRELVFDSSFKISKDFFTNSSFSFEIERRKFEDVKRSKFLFWNISEVKGVKSILSFINVSKIDIKRKFNSNDFINGISLLENGDILLEGSLGSSIYIKPMSQFRIELKDISFSDFGKGRIFAKVGFTKKEWVNYFNKNDKSRPS